MVRLPRVGGTRVKDDLALDGPGFGVPVGGVRQVTDQLQVFHALKVGEHFSSVRQEVWENVVHVSVKATCQ